MFTPCSTSHTHQYSPAPVLFSVAGWMPPTIRRRRWWWVTIHTEEWKHGCPWWPQLTIADVHCILCINSYNYWGKPQHTTQLLLATMDKSQEELQCHEATCTMLQHAPSRKLDILLSHHHWHAYVWHVLHIQSSETCTVKSNSSDGGHYNYDVTDDVMSYSDWTGSCTDMFVWATCCMRATSTWREFTYAIKTLSHSVSLALP